MLVFRANGEKTRGWCMLKIVGADIHIKLLCCGIAGSCCGALQPGAALTSDCVCRVGLLWRQAHLQAIQRAPGRDLRAGLPRERLPLHLREGTLTCSPTLNPPCRPSPTNALLGTARNSVQLRRRAKFHLTCKATGVILSGLRRLQDLLSGGLKVCAKAWWRDRLLKWRMMPL